MNAAALRTRIPEQVIGDVALSRDGSTWVEYLDEEMFDASLPWLAGERRAVTLLACNDSESPVEIVIQGSAPRLGEAVSSGFLTVSADGPGLTWTSEPATCGFRLAAVLDSSPGCIPLTLALECAADSDSRLDLSALVVSVHLGSDAAPSCPPSTTARLVRPLRHATAATAGVLAGLFLGAALVRHRPLR